MHTTTLVPKGYYRLVEDSTTEIEENTPDEGPIPIPTTAQMGSADFWVHHTQNILLANRLAHMDPEEVPDDVDPEDVKKQIEAKDPYEARLKPISADKAVQDAQPGWVVKTFGDTTLYNQGNPILPKVSNAVVVAKSLHWPGAYNFFYQGRWFQMYVGDGLKYEEKTYYPVFPPTVIDDPEVRAGKFLVAVG